MTKLHADFFSHNRDMLSGLVARKGPIVIPSAGLLQKSADTTYTFRQDSNFWYLTGINEPDIVLVIDRDETYLIMPHRNSVQVLFDGEIVDSDLVTSSGIAQLYPSKQGWQKLKDSARRSGEIACIAVPPAYIDVYGFYTNPARSRVIRSIKRSVPDLIVHDIRPELAKLRSVKQPDELSIVNEVVSATLSSITLLERELSTLKFEYEAAALLTHEFYKRGYKHGYQPIVASGVNACTVHYIHNDSPIDQSSYLLLDVGAESSYYSADITRVLHPTTSNQRQQDIFAVVKNVQEYAMSLLKPGVILAEYEKKVEAYMGQKLLKLGLITGQTTTEIRRYFPYLASHFLGLDVHDVGDRHAPLDEGMVLTVEPGIHVPEEGIAVRLEDDIVITKSGMDILGAKR